MQGSTINSSPAKQTKFEFTIPLDEALRYQKVIFIDPAINKMYYEAKKAIDRVGINPEDLIERTQEEFEKTAKREKQIVTDEVIEMRYKHFENRRRKKMKIVAEYLRSNKQNLTYGNVSKSKTEQT